MWFNENKDLVKYQTPSPMGIVSHYIPARQVKIIHQNLCEGKDWSIASPVYPISREEAAFILCNWVDTVKKI